jgi:hypothetical protein
VLHHRRVRRERAGDAQVSIIVHIQRTDSLRQLEIGETQLRSRLPAGSDIAAFVLMVPMWPAMLFGVNVCVV